MTVKNQIIDFRSDTVTLPSLKMKSAILKADVGDDVFGEDPSINKLESYTANLFKKESGLFLPSGTQSNLIAIITHCERGDEFIVGQQAHNYKYEGGGASIFGGIQPQPIDQNKDGSIDIEKIKAYIKPLNDYHFTNTKLISLENTFHGKILPLSYIQTVYKFAQKKKLLLHLDGARIFNALIEKKLNPSIYSPYFNSISICFSKGLGSPAGSMLLGNSNFINRARRWRKVLGGGMRQSGILASACLFALKNNVDRLKKDHIKAKKIYKKLRSLKYFVLDGYEPETNMVFFNLKTKKKQKEFFSFMRNAKIKFLENEKIRLVTHLDISKSNMDYFFKKLDEFESLV
jgi:threonine aldolase